jgi:hypothetical protein
MEQHSSFHRAMTTRTAVGYHRRRLAVTGVLALGLCTLVGASPSGAVVGLPTDTAGLPADGNGVELGPTFSVEDPGPGLIAGFPASFAADTVVNGVTTKKVFVSYSRGPDVATSDGATGLRISTDGGSSYPQYQENTTGVGSVVRLASGCLLAVQFIPEWTDSTHTAINLDTRTSCDMGSTWQVGKAAFTTPAGASLDPSTFDRGLRMTGPFVTLADGTLIVPAYTQFVGDAHNRSILLQSKDQGQSFTVRSTINATNAAGQGSNEVGLSRTVDGRLLAVLRTANGSSNLLSAYSSDNGLTWTPAVALTGPSGADTSSVDPVLVLQPNGVLLLSYGRPDNKLLVSYDGDGTSWQDYQVTFANPPTVVGPARNHGSSGNTSMVSVAANRTLLFGDACAPSWGCKQYHEDYDVWARHVDAVTPGTGKLDLATKARAGLVTASGTFAAPRAEFPEARPEGAFDGSVLPNAAAVLTNSSGRPTMTVALDHTYTLNRIGLMLGYGIPQDADVSLSTDGTTWTSPVLSARSRTDYALRYTDITAQQAKYVRIQAPDGGTLNAVTELELYSDVDTFENDPVFGPPRGFTDVKNADVTTVGMGGYQSGRSLQLLDLATDASANATRISADESTESVAFQWGTADFRGAFLFDVRGRDSTGALNTPWHFALAPISGTTNATLRADDSTGTWQDIATITGVGTVNTWIPITISATLASATVSVNGHSYTTSARYQTPAHLSGVGFGSAGTSPYGMEFFIDDLSVH